MELKHPQFLFLFVVFIPMLWIMLRRERGKRATIRFSDLSDVKQVKPSLRIRLRHSVFVCRLLGMSLLVIALCRPRFGRTEEEITTEGVDIMLVLDVSTSMRALDFKPDNRLHVAKKTIEEFIYKREHDRIGLVEFAARSHTRCPLTLDYGILVQFLQDIRFGDIEDGTAIGTAIATAANRLKDSKAKSRVIILLTDGENNRGEIAPLTAARAAAELGIKIYTIGVGKEGQVPYPFEYNDPWSGKKKTVVRSVESQLDEQMLVDIAEMSGAEFFRAHNAEKLREIYDNINRLEKTEIQTKSYTTWSERFHGWLIGGFLFLLAEVLLGSTVFRRIP